MSTATATEQQQRPYSRTQMVRELRAYGAHPTERRVPRGEWEDAEWDRLAELAVGAH